MKNLAQYMAHSTISALVMTVSLLVITWGRKKANPHVSLKIIKISNYRGNVQEYELITYNLTSIFMHIVKLAEISCTF